MSVVDPASTRLEGLEEHCRQVRLLDHHCHSVVRRDLTPEAFEALLGEGEAPGAGISRFDSLLGLSVRRWCAPVLDLPEHASSAQYLARRQELGWREVTGRMLRGCGVRGLLVDSGYRPEELLSLHELSEAAGAPVAQVVRIESVVEQAAPALSADGFAAGLAEAVMGACGTARDGTTPVGLKSVAAYRTGLDLPERPPDPGEVSRAAGRWLRSAPRRLADPTLIAAAVWAAADTGLPLQFHTGFGDPDARVVTANPALLQPFAAASRAPVVLLHCWPYHRQAAWLAHVLPNVYLDIGLAVPYVGVRAAAVLAETLELAPVGKLLYSSDAFGLPELHLLGALRSRGALAEVLGGWVSAGELTAGDAVRVASMVAAENAVRLYRLQP